MPRQSSVKQLPSPILKAVNDALERGDTLDKILERIKNDGADVSRSALGRYRQNWQDLRDRLAQTREAAKVIAMDLTDDASRDQAALLVELVQTAIFQAAQGDVPDAEAAAQLSRAVANLARARGTLVDLEAKIRRDTAKAVDEIAKAKGLSTSVSDAIRNAIEGKPKPRGIA